MKRVTLFMMSIGSLGLLWLSACSSSQPTTTSSPRTATPTEAIAPVPGSHPKTSQGGQIIESGPYHLEFVPIKEPQGTHLDFYLQKGDDHTPIPDATVSAQIQRPDGTQKSLALKYDPDGQHYAAMFTDITPGDYKVVILTDINGEKVNGRFGFKQ